MDDNGDAKSYVDTLYKKHPKHIVNFIVISGCCLTRLSIKKDFTRTHMWPKSAGALVLAIGGARSICCI